LQARAFDDILESRLGEKHLGIMSGAGAGVLINAFLHEKSSLPVDEVGQRPCIADRRAAAEQLKKPQWFLRNRPHFGSLKRG
jgi:hypothetical protein